MATATKKKPAVKPIKPGGRGRAERNFNAALWSVPMSVEFSGLCHERILELIHAGEIEAVAVGLEQLHVWANGTTRRRSCAKFLVVAASLKKFVKTLAVRGKLLRSA